MRKRLVLLLATAALLAAWATPAHATGWYDENGYHHTDQPGDICYDRGGVAGTDAIPGEPESGVPTWQLIVICGNGEVFVIAAGYGTPMGSAGGDFFFTLYAPGGDGSPPPPGGGPQGVMPWEDPASPYYGMSECEYWAAVAGRHYQARR